MYIYMDILNGVGFYGHYIFYRLLSIHCFRIPALKCTFCLFEPVVPGSFVRTAFDDARSFIYRSEICKKHDESINMRFVDGLRHIHGRY